MTLRQQGVAHRKNRTVTIVRAHIWTSIRTWPADLDLNTEPAPPGSPALPRSANYERREAVKIAPAPSAHSGGYLRPALPTPLTRTSAAYTFSRAARI